MESVILRLTWSQTGDYFDVVPENPNFAAWFVDQCNNFSNDFFCTDMTQSSDQLIDQIKDNIVAVNKFLRQIKFAEIPIFDDLCNQHNLNLTHKNWITVVRKEPRIDRLLYKTSPELFDQFHDINFLVHRLEKSFKYKFLNKNPWRVDNKFVQTLPSNGMYNVYVNYTDWGKSSWHKFVDGVDAPNDFELNNWESIGSDISINLVQPYQQVFPPEYLSYCEKNQIGVSVRFWPLGNLVDYPYTMPTVRNIMNKNVNIANNILKFSIVE
jgi:hypothetical protein